MSDVIWFIAVSFIIVIILLFRLAVSYFRIKIDVGTPRISWKQEVVYKFVRGDNEEQVKGLFLKTKQLAGVLDVIVISYSDVENKEVLHFLIILRCI
jgi:hypothetical protein